MSSRRRHDDLRDQKKTGNNGIMIILIMRCDGLIMIIMITID